MPATVSAQFIIGIDLGTTHSVLSYKKIDDYQAAADIFHVDQLVGPGIIARKPLLPSFRYHFNQDEIAAHDCVLPWQKSVMAGDIEHLIIGEWARELGSKSSARLVSSAKSWLSHTNIDAQASILPWAAADGIAKVSPVIASASYLNHFRQSWDHHHPEQPLAQQVITITVPASFNDSARALTIAAAKLAGLPNISLLEEPQAVCYDWYQRNKQAKQDLIDNDKTMLVCDIGGGTTDLSLIEMTVSQGELQLNRVAVGNHLMLGGDNIDLALAHIVESRISPGQRLSTAALGQLIQQTRHAKELFLSAQPPSTTSITLLGRGAKLIAQAKSCELTKNEVINMVFDGFLPLSKFTDLPNHRQNAVIEFGLPFTSDPAISKHIAEFIAQHYQIQGAEDYDKSLIPGALLVNGGIFNSAQVKLQLDHIMAHWKQSKVQVLRNGNPDLAVACGAVEYGFACLGKQAKISGGSPRNYFIELQDRQGHCQTICLLPKGCPEEQRIDLQSRLFSLTIGEPIQFNLTTTSQDHNYQPGDIVSEELTSKTSLPPFVVTIHKQQNDHKQRFESVYLSCKLSSVGTLQIDCVSNSDNKKRWALEFSIRNASQRQNAEIEDSSNSANQAGHPNLYKAIALIEAVYGASSKNANPKLVKSIRTDLDKLLGKRENWDTAQLRALATPCINFAKNRRRSEVHERNWLKLTSFLVRPGFGYPADDWRIEQLWPLFKSAIQYNKSTQSWSDWWNLWRRIAGGLNAQQQLEIYQTLAIYLVEESNKNAKIINQAKQRSYDDIIRLLASLEHIPVTLKIEFAEFLQGKIAKGQHPQLHWWALGRVASRSPFYGSLHNVIPSHIVTNWLNTMLTEDWLEHPYIAFAAVMMARKTGDRALDIDEQLRSQLIEKLGQSKSVPTWISLLQEVENSDDAVMQRFFGDSLPVGLTLLD